MSVCLYKHVLLTDFYPVWAAKWPIKCNNRTLSELSTFLPLFKDLPFSALLHFGLCPQFHTERQWCVYKLWFYLWNFDTDLLTPSVFLFFCLTSCLLYKSRPVVLQSLVRRCLTQLLYLFGDLISALKPTKGL